MTEVEITMEITMSTNQIHGFSRGPGTIFTSTLHTCAVCAGIATRPQPLLEWWAITDMGKRKPKPFDARFYAHEVCFKIQRETEETKKESSNF